jgi:hypothetical protein
MHNSIVVMGRWVRFVVLFVSDSQRFDLAFACPAVTFPRFQLILSNFTSSKLLYSCFTTLYRITLLSLASNPRTGFDFVLLIRWNTIDLDLLFLLRLDTRSPPFVASIRTCVCAYTTATPLLTLLEGHCRRLHSSLGGRVLTHAIW